MIKSIKRSFFSHKCLLHGDVRCVRKAFSPCVRYIYDNWILAPFSLHARLPLVVGLGFDFSGKWPNSHLYGTDTWHKPTNHTSFHSLGLTLWRGLDATYPNHMKGIQSRRQKGKDNVEKAKVNQILLPWEKDVVDGKNFANSLCPCEVEWLLRSLHYQHMSLQQSSCCIGRNM